MLTLVIIDGQFGRHSSTIRIIQIDTNLASTNRKTIQNLLLGEVNLLNLMHVYEVKL